MKFRFCGDIDSFTKKYSEARDKFNKEHPSKSFPLVVYLRGGRLEVGIEKGQNGGSYWFNAPIVERNGYLELEAEIEADKDMRMRWYDWIGFSLLFIIVCIPMLIACLVTKSSPFGTKKKRIARLRSYMCEYLGCEEIV